MSRILAIHRYYWPDTPPYASLLRSIVEEWARVGHTVEVLTSQPSYKPEARVERQPSRERLGGVTVRRVRMKPDRASRWQAAFNVVWFPAVVAARILLGRRRDVVMCSTAPPVLLAWAVSLVARIRGAHFVYHCMDVHPEIGRLSGDFARPTVFALLRRLDVATCRRARCIVVLSEDMRAAILERDPEVADKVVVLTNFELPDHQGTVEASPLQPDPARVRIAFTGNVGRFQGLETVVEAVVDPRNDLDALELVLMGEGSAKETLRRLVASAPPEVRDRVRFVPHGSPARARALLDASDLGLVSLQPRVIRYAYPSKTATYLRAGLPVLVAVEPDSVLARSIVEARVGEVLPARDVQATGRVLRSWIERRGELGEMSRRARDLWARDYAADSILPLWVGLVRELEDSKPQRVGARR